MCLIFKNTMKSMGEKEKTQYFYCFQNQRMIEEPGNNSCDAVFFLDLMARIHKGGLFQIRGSNLVCVLK